MERLLYARYFENQQKEKTSATPGTETFNCQVVSVERLQPGAQSFFGSPVIVLCAAAGELVFLGLKVDDGETKAFEKIG